MTTCSRLLVADPLGLFVAPLHAADLEQLDVSDLVESLAGPAEVPAPLGAVTISEGVPARLVDTVTPVHPVVLRQDGNVILAWDPANEAYVALRLAHLAVLDLARFATSVEYLLTLLDQSAWPVEPNDLCRAVTELAAVELLGLQAESDTELELDSAGDSAGSEVGAEREGSSSSEGSLWGDDRLAVAEEIVVPPDTTAHPVPPEQVDSATEPGLFEDLPEGAVGLKVAAYRAAVRSRRTAKRSIIRLGRNTAIKLQDRFGVESDDWPDPGPEFEPVPEAEASPETGSADEPRVDEDDGPSVGDAPERGQAQDDQPADDPAEAGPAGEVDESVAATRSDPRTPVFAVYYSPEHNASLGLGLIMAYARVVNRGALNTDFDLRKARIDADPMLEELERTGRQAIVLFSDFMWSVDHNLAVSARVKELNPNSITIHGGPHAPKYEGDAERFFADNPQVDILARGEGELTVAEMLPALGKSPDATRLADYLSEVEGITFRSGTPDSYTLVRTPDRKRATDMDDFPSPYLTGEFDEIDPARWRSATIETNRGCPYGCTFCDWGSVTNSRIRQFGHDRVFAELEWLAARGISEIFLADANFGLFAHDVEVTQHIADLKNRYGAPSQIICSFAKNTVKNTAQIVRILVEAGICAEGSVALQTTDETTLANVERSNIKVEKYDALAAEFRRHRLPIVTDLLMGLPGATVESFKNDLQRCLDQEVTPRMMETVLLPNSPMNSPSYKERFQIQTDESNVLVSTISYTRADFDEMRRLRLLFRACEHYGLLRHLFRWLQVEHGIRSLDLIHVIDQTIENRPEEYPLLTWVGRYFDLITAPPGGWPPFYDEVVKLLAETYGIERDSAMDTVLEVQMFLMPSHGRQFPAHIRLEHDYASWYHATSLDAEQDAPPTNLIDMPAGELVVDDPAGICDARLLRNGFSIRREEACDNPFWVLNDWELDSELARPMATAVPLLSGS